MLPKGSAAGSTRFATPAAHIATGCWLLVALAVGCCCLMVAGFFLFRARESEKTENLKTNTRKELGTPENTREYLKIPNDTVLGYGLVLSCLSPVLSQLGLVLGLPWTVLLGPALGMPWAILGL